MSVTPKDMLNRKGLPIASYFVDIYGWKRTRQTNAFYYMEHKALQAKLPGICIEAFDNTLRTMGLYATNSRQHVFISALTTP